MKILFIQSEFQKLSVEYLSTFLRQAGHEVELFFDPRIFCNSAFNIDWLSRRFNTDSFLRQALKRFKPDVAAFSVTTYDFQWALEKARFVKNFDRDISIIFGGIHPTLCPETVINKPEVDAVCIGEGEEPLLMYVERHKNKNFNFKIPNLWIKSGNRMIKNKVEFMNEDLDRLPFPEKADYYKANPIFKNIYYLITGRGCSFRCAYCSNNALHNIYKQGFARRRSIENVISELKNAKIKYRPKRIEFLDESTFCEDSNYARSFLKEYRKEIGIPMMLMAHCSFLNDELCKLLKEANCIYIELGLQSEGEDYRRKILQRPEKNSDYVKAAALLKKYKISFSIDHIFNMPFENEASYSKAVLFYNKLRPDFISTFQLQYFPNTDITKLALKEGILKKADVENIRNGIILTPASPGIRKQDTESNANQYQNYQFWMHIIPFIPQRLFYKVFNRWQTRPKKFPSAGFVMLKFIAMAKAGAGFFMWFQIVFHIQGVWRYYKKLLKGPANNKQQKKRI